ncbi:MAG: hypothetical protein PHG66_06300 [Candidatus Colwellbacteria bacterium]|nr:hypothetical protein [Candidatus Colwellbacteria bacterium]
MPKSYASQIHQVVKANKLISRGLKMIPHPIAQKASKIAEDFGYGEKKKKRKRKQSGRGLGSIAGSVFDHIFGTGAKKPKKVRLVRM